MIGLRWRRRAPQAMPSPHEVPTCTQQCGTEDGSLVPCGAPAAWVETGRCKSCRRVVEEFLCDPCHTDHEADYAYGFKVEGPQWGYWWCVGGCEMPAVVMAWRPL